MRKEPVRAGGGSTQANDCSEPKLVASLETLSNIRQDEDQSGLRLQAEAFSTSCLSGKQHLHRLDDHDLDVYRNYTQEATVLHV